MSENKLFEAYTEEKKGGLLGLLQTPKGWLTLFSIIAVIVLIVLFYKMAVLDVMSNKDLAASLQILSIKTTWVTKDSTPQSVKIVPIVRLRVKNIGQRELQYLDIQAVFRQTDKVEEFSDGMVRLFSKPLMPGQSSEEITITSFYGYTATSIAAFWANRQEWKPLQAKLFARAKGSGLVHFGEVYDVPQEIEGFVPGASAATEKPAEYSNPITKQLAHSLQVVSQESLWMDKLPRSNQTIIVPTITLTLKNVGPQALEKVVIKGVFMYEDTGEILSEGITDAAWKSLEPGQTTPAITVKADFGYSATTKEAFFYNNQKWKRLKVKLYAKTKESDDALLATFPISQTIQGLIIKAVSN